MRPLPLLPSAALLAALAAAAAAQETELRLPPDAPDALRRVLETASLTLSLEGEGLTAPTDYVAAARADYRRLLTGLYAEGHYGGAISITVDGREASTIEPLDAPARVGSVVLSVTPGPVFRFGTAAIGPLAPATALPEGFAAGEVARSETIRDAVAAAVSAWRDAGHARAGVGAQELVADQPAARLDAAVEIAPGPRLAFGDVTVGGNEAVRTARILRIAGLREGAVFSPDDLDLAAARLRRTGAFDSVAVVEGEEAGPGDTLPITLQVAETLPRRFGVAAELSSLDGLSAETYLLFRNLRGGAERLRLDASVSDIGSEQAGVRSGGVDTALGVTFSRPATFAADNDLVTALAFEREDAEDYLLTQVGASFGITRYASEALTVTGAVDLTLAGEETVLGTSDYAILSLPLDAAWDRRDDPADARRGFYLAGEVRPFAGVAGEAGSGLRLHGDARAYRDLGPRLVLAGRAQAGSVLGAASGDVPQDYLFFSGGGGTVRGQSYQSLGLEVPVPDEPGETLTLGAPSFVGAQVEARLRVAGSFGAVAFYDVGAVGEDGLLGGEMRSQSGAGLGLRYATGLGPIRVDLATPASGDGAFEELQLYIGIGQAF